MGKKKEIPVHKFVAIDDEVRTSMNLIHTGFAELQNIKGANDFFYFPFLLLSNGFEKLLKLIICLYYWEQFGEFPTLEDFKRSKKDNGHNLLYLKDIVVKKCYFVDTPELEKDLYFLKGNVTLNKLIDFLGEFGQYSRYYNLDVIISNKKQRSKNIKLLWEGLEADLLIADSELFEKFKYCIEDNDNLKLRELEIVNKQVRAKTIILLELFTRALTRLFVSGKMEQAKIFREAISTFLLIDDSELGQRDYNKIERIN